MQYLMWSRRPNMYVFTAEFTAKLGDLFFLAGRSRSFLAGLEELKFGLCEAQGVASGLSTSSITKWLSEQLCMQDASYLVGTPVKKPMSTEWKEKTQ